MPKRGKNRGWSSDNDFREPRREVYYYEHDDRTGNGDHTRRVTFKPGNSSRISKNRRNNITWEPPQGRIIDDDVDMQGPSAKNNRRYNPYSGGRGNGRGRGRRGGGGGGGRVHSPVPAHRAKLVEVPSSWYKVTIPHGGKHDKNYLISVLLAHLAPVVFIPIAYRVQGQESTFFVDDYDMASKLMNADRKITLNDGYKLLVQVRPGLPQMDISEAFKERMKLAMAKRYNPATRALDLAKFHMDPLLMEDYVAALFRPPIMQAALKIVAEHIPDIVALNLADNRLCVIDHLSSLSRMFPSLAVLHLANNKIRDIKQLDAMKELDLVDLVLEGNPLTDRFSEKSVYVREVRDRFPKVIKLDGVELPPPIKFDNEDENVRVPPNCGSFLCSVEGGNVVRQFLEQYFQLYDSDNRLPLVDAYHEKATMSMSCSYGNTAGPKLDDYICHSRNLKRVNDPEKRERLIHRGNVHVVAFLAKLPKTMHDAPSFAVDLPLCTPSLLVLCVSGVFRELRGERQAMRSFSRMFVIVPVGSGFCIADEKLHITNATPQQMKFAFKPVVPAVVPPPVVAPPTANLADPNVRLQMIEEVKRQTNMNSMWANKCLEETQWDFQRAITTFASLHSQGSIPAEAFVKMEV